MARKSKSKRDSGLLDHQGFLMWEALMAVGLVQELVVGWILTLNQIPPMLRVTAGVAVVVGTLGGLALIVRRQTVRGLGSTHRVVRKWIPLPRLGLHALILFGLFLGYAWLWDEQTGALGWIWRTLAG